MASSNTPKEVQMISANDLELDEFKAGVVRSMKQYNTGLVKTFDNVEDLLNDLHAAE
jgi:hypothetical protein